MKRLPGILAVLIFLQPCQGQELEILHFQRAQQLLDDGDPARAVAHLVRAASLPKAHPRAGRKLAALFEERLWPRRIPLGEAAWIDAALSPDGKRIAATTGENLVHVFALENGAFELLKNSGPVNRVHFDPSGWRVVCESIQGGTLSIWDAHSGERIAEIEAEKIARIEFAGCEGRVLVWTRGGDFRAIDLETGEQLLELADVHQFATSADGTILATAAKGSGGITTRRLDSFEVLATIPSKFAEGREFGPMRVAISRDGSELGALNGLHRIQRHEVYGGEPIGEPIEPGGVIQQMRFDHESGLWIRHGAGEIGRDPTTTSRLNPATGEIHQLDDPPGFQHWIDDETGFPIRIDFRKPDLTIRFAQGPVRRFSIPTWFPGLAISRQHGFAIAEQRFDPIDPSRRGDLIRIHSRTPVAPIETGGGIRTLEFDSSGRQLLVEHHRGGGVELWDLGEAPPDPPFIEETGEIAGWSADGRFLIREGFNLWTKPPTGWIAVHNARTLEWISTLRPDFANELSYPDGLALSPDGSRATVLMDGWLTFFEAQTGEQAGEPVEIEGRAGPLKRLRFTADGAALFVETDWQRVEVRDPATAELIGQALELESGIHRFDLESRRVVARDFSVWEWRGAEFVKIRGAPDLPEGVWDVSPDGELFLETHATPGAEAVWLSIREVETRELRAPPVEVWDIEDAAFDASGEFIFVAGAGLLLDAETGIPLREPIRGYPKPAIWSPDGTAALIPTDSKEGGPLVRIELRGPMPAAFAEELGKLAGWALDERGNFRKIAPDPENWRQQLLAACADRPEWREWVDRFVLD